MSIQPTFEMKADAIWARIYIDGMPVRGNMFRKSETEKRGGSARCVVHGSVQKVGAEEILRKFKFTDILATDIILGDRQNLSQKDLAMSGIVVKIFEVTDPPIQASEQPAGANFLADRREKAIDEKLVNGQTLHAIGYGNAEKARPLPVTFVEKTEEKPLGELLAIFKFRYFPKEHLQRLGVVASTPTPEPEPGFMRGVNQDVKQEKDEGQPMNFEQEGNPTSAVPSPGQRGTKIDLDFCSMREQFELLKELRAKLNLNPPKQVSRKPATTLATRPGPRPTNSSAARTGIRKPTTKKPVLKKSNVARANQIPFRVTKDKNGKEMIDLTDD